MANGTGSHNSPVIIGFGEDSDDEEKGTVMDLTAKRCGKAGIVHPGMNGQVDVLVSRSFEDDTIICVASKRYAG
ncbi:MAG: hypothetical protein ACUVTR_06395 [Dehalococcoidia bacterium]